MNKINEIWLKVEGFKYATSINLNMGYEHIWLSYDTSNLCMIIPPGGKYHYKSLPTEVRKSQNIFQ